MNDLLVQQLELPGALPQPSDPQVHSLVSGEIEDQDYTGEVIPSIRKSNETWI